MREWVGIFGAFLLLAVIASWPLAANLETLVTSARAESDLGYSIYSHWWAGEVIAGRAPFDHNSLVYFPAGQAMISSVWNLVTLFGTAWLHLFMEPIGAWNGAVLAVMALNGVGGFALGRRLGGTRGGVLAGATALLFPICWTEGFEGRLEQAFTLPISLSMLGLHDLGQRREGAWRTAGIGIGLVGATYWFMAPLFVVAALPLLIPILRDRSGRMELLKSALAALAILLPALAVAWPHISGELIERTNDGPHQLLMRTGNSLLLPFDLPTGRLPMGRAIPLVGLAALGAAWFREGGRRWVAVALIAVMLAMGPALQVGGVPVSVGGRLIPLPMALLDLLPGFERFWWPYRALLIAGPACAAAIAVAFPRERMTLLLTIAIVAISTAESRFAVQRAVSEGDPSIPISPFDPTPGAHYFQRHIPGWFRDAPSEGAVIDHPLRESANIAPLHATYHQLPTVIGDGAHEATIRPASFEEHTAESLLLSSWASGEVLRTSDQDRRRLSRGGYRWLAWHLPNPSLYPTLHDEALDEVEAAKELLGAPIHEERRLVVFSLTPPLR